MERLLGGLAANDGCHLVPRIERRAYDVVSEQPVAPVTQDYA